MRRFSSLPVTMPILIPFIDHVDEAVEVATFRVVSDESCVRSVQPVLAIGEDVFLGVIQDAPDPATCGSSPPAAHARAGWPPTMREWGTGLST